MLASIASLVLLALSNSGVNAQSRPENTSICDFYTTALLKNNTAENQYTVLTLLVNTAVVGNYTQPNMNAVPGILASNATFNGKSVDLAKYFTGAIESTNINNTATAVNWLDGGGAAPLMNNTPSDNTASRQNALLTHLYSFFGSALGCSTVGNDSFPAYSGDPSMFNVHKFMHLDSNEVGYFIQQVGLSAASFGVSKEDVTAVGDLLTKVFDVKCSPAFEVIPGQGAQLQSICIDDSCKQANPANCSAYGNIAEEPVSATSTAPSPTTTVSGSAPAPPGQSSSTPSDGAAIPNGYVSPLLTAIAGLFAFML